VIFFYQGHGGFYEQQGKIWREKEKGQRKSEAVKRSVPIASGLSPVLLSALRCAVLGYHALQKREQQRPSKAGEWASCYPAPRRAATAGVLRNYGYLFI
jgi:hypothetical protein